MKNLLCCLLLIAAGGLLPRTLPADQFEYLDEDGAKQTIEARLYASGQGVMALERADGSLEIVPEQAIQKRTPGPDPVPVTPQQMLERLQREFGAEKFRGTVSDQYVIGVVLTAPLPKTSEKRVQASLIRAARYMESIEVTFRKFCSAMRIEPQKPRFPLVVLIFETDPDFEAYNQKLTGGRGLSASATAGFYMQTTNQLYVRMSECYTFATPLHEAIHQQCFNTGVLARLAPIPVWFAEGIATGFEGAGDRVQGDPQKLNAVYAKLLLNLGRIPSTLNWNDVVRQDGAFRGDIFAGEAYLHAWSLHWLLVSKYRNTYSKYLEYLRTLEPLSEVDATTRFAKFQEVFGETPDDIQRGFRGAFELALKKQKLPPDPNDQPGLLSKQTNLAGIDMYVESRNEGTFALGRLRNISPLRDMSYCVVVLTNAGTYAQWHVPKLKINEQSQLPARVLPDFGAGSFQVIVHAAPADSDEATRWNRGQLPDPLPRRR